MSLLIYPACTRVDDPIGPNDPGQFTDRHDKIAVEGVGVVHVLTEIPADDPGYAFTDVIVQQYAHGVFLPPVPMTGSVTDSWFALSMHTHWCDTERIIRCLMGQREPLTLQDIEWGDEETGDLPELDGDLRDHPGYTPRVAALITRAVERGVRVPDIAALGDPP